MLLNRKTAFAIFGVLSLFLVVQKLPYEQLLATYFEDETAHYVKEILFSSLIIFYSVFLIRRWNLELFSGLVRPRFANLYLYIIPCYLFLFNDLSNLKSLNLFRVFIPFCGILLHAFAEELTFRGIVLSTLVKQNLHSLMQVKKAIVASAFIFGFAHFISLFRYDFISVLCQVIYATILGLLFGILHVKGNNIYLLGLLHGSVNIASRIHVLYNSNENSVDLENNTSAVLSILITFIIFSPLLLASLYWLGRITLRDTNRLIPSSDVFKNKPWDQRSGDTNKKTTGEYTVNHFSQEQEH